MDDDCVRGGGPGANKAFVLDAEGRCGLLDAARCAICERMDACGLRSVVRTVYLYTWLLGGRGSEERPLGALYGVRDFFVTEVVCVYGL
eukprot:5844594-Prymnesium_polylepis.1